MVFNKPMTKVRYPVAVFNIIKCKLAGLSRHMLGNTVEGRFNQHSLCLCGSLCVGIVNQTGRDGYGNRLYSINYAVWKQAVSHLMRVPVLSTCLSYGDWGSFPFTSLGRKEEIFQLTLYVSVCLYVSLFFLFLSMCMYWCMTTSMYCLYVGVDYTYIDINALAQGIK